MSNHIKFHKEFHKFKIKNKEMKLDTSQFKALRYRL